jgi:hypothetical protein
VQRIAVGWTALVALSIGSAWVATRPRFDAQAVGTIVETRETKGAVAPSYEQVITFKTPQKEMRVTYALLKSPFQTPIVITYSSANPDLYGVYDPGAFGHACQVILIAAVLMGGFAVRVGQRIASRGRRLP